MVEEIDIWRSARVLIRQHGEQASIEAAKLADAMLERGDLDGLAVWKRVMAAVEELQRSQSAEGEARH